MKLFLGYSVIYMKKSFHDPKIEILKIVVEIGEKMKTS